ncbi:hypothetical protein [Roseovarius sp. MMSF_3281]|uniref:hypothetical protein n=1 Tax=Roseovarius sp. MMSF_3281 TaxID=3046694 RepID=UPI00273DFD34|nr:hypothetical protein [Roseovarius sp. MMSF_3281]
MGVSIGNSFDEDVRVMRAGLQREPYLKLENGLEAKMSVPYTNVEKQKQTHKTASMGIRGVMGVPQCFFWV